MHTYGRVRPLQLRCGPGAWHHPGVRVVRMLVVDLGSGPVISCKTVREITGLAFSLEETARKILLGTESPGLSTLAV